MTLSFSFYNMHTLVFIISEIIIIIPIAICKNEHWVGVSGAYVVLMDLKANITTMMRMYLYGHL